MPINRKKYHPKWTLISYLIRVHRAKNHCEVCGIKNYRVGYWEKGTWYDPENAEPPEFDNFKEAKAWAEAYNDEIGELYDPATRKVWMIILTTAHLDHNVQNNRFWNLRAKCQYCHLTHDRKDNAIRRIYGPTGRHHNQLRLL
ncbi:hypothetical protein GCM10028818_00930 [Spirosoma horti]